MTVFQALEHNLSINSAYLEELSLRYKRQMEEMQKQFTSALNAIKNSSISGEPPLSQHKREEREEDNRLEVLQQQVEKLSQVNTLSGYNFMEYDNVNSRDELIHIYYR